MKIKHDGPFSLENATRTEYGSKRIYGGGGGNSGTSTTMASIAPEFKPLVDLYTKQATSIAQTPWQSYNGQRYADLNQTQNLGIGMVQNRALNGDPLMDAGSNYLQNQLQSGPQSATQNPYGDVSAGSVTPGQNAYAGANPYLDAAVSRAQGSVVDQFNNMTKPQTEAAMRNSGSFGNSGLNQMMQIQQKAAGEQLGDISSKMYMQDYGMQQGLAENAINRDMSAQQYNVGNNMAAQQFNSNMGNDWAGRNDAAYQNSVGNNLNATQQGLQYGNAAYQDAGQLLNAGGLQQQQAQQGLDFAYSQHQAEQDNPYKQLSATGGVVQSGMGSSTTQTGGGK